MRVSQSFSKSPFIVACNVCCTRRTRSVVGGGYKKLSDRSKLAWRDLALGLADCFLKPETNTAESIKHFENKPKAFQDFLYTVLQ